MRKTKEYYLNKVKVLLNSTEMSFLNVSINKYNILFERVLNSANLQ